MKIDENLNKNIYTILLKFYENQDDLQLSYYTYETVMDKKEVISLYKSQNYIDNLKETLEGMKGLQIYEHIESFNSKYIRRILYKDDESKQEKEKEKERKEKKGKGKDEEKDKEKDENEEEEKKKEKKGKGKNEKKRKRKR
ncbi:hypothetical protein LY90DRAFT_511054 [Neocallimastix californiae]|uniref:Uncharacterized protein n=1 Tax=Neocallimastix californiae TaxID=1754190 RepID=A0A1Y2BTT9_9FUNG|nr:hypothetical protein LY90DRAFT_511054 [Neocallimastix californiae]|eukprot:ORY38047.1 hypothetical protein LY90DRAFT_511054 [Neocallimastix californiae]